MFRLRKQAFKQLGTIDLDISDSDAKAPCQPIGNRSGLIKTPNPAPIAVILTRKELHCRQLRCAFAELISIAIRLMDSDRRASFRTYKNVYRFQWLTEIRLKVGLNSISVRPVRFKIDRYGF